MNARFETNTLKDCCTKSQVAILEQPQIAHRESNPHCVVGPFMTYIIDIDYVIASRVSTVRIVMPSRQREGGAQLCARHAPSTRQAHYKHTPGTRQARPRHTPCTPKQGGLLGRRGVYAVARRGVY